MLAEEGKLALQVTAKGVCCCALQQGLLRPVALGSCQLHKTSAFSPLLAVMPGCLKAWQHCAAGFGTQHINQGFRVPSASGCQAMGLVC